ncbi:ABC transporter ATP-binding protein [Thalassomonas viridans]|uniref:ABC transporter ATP-binding protein n=1 Tax=Thalassomonas viridans TaxID=137584 RepID=A0AAE9Z8Y7_9GAMM|nr:ABC transporter ATP-binding protein [Thalassomonas viridans]WDE08886.1 ABC transporter ATP-binding protein [Thalassomonas viridans]WDE08933.1 ABC transporter ATP-binding protein [Thalassomonas viridans]
MLLLENVSKSYQKNQVINNLTYRFDEDRYCITGPNGSGKTTLLMLAAGLEMVSSGRIILDGAPVYSALAKRRLGISSDKILLPDFLTPQQLLEFHCAQHHRRFPEDLIEMLDFAGQLTTRVSALSLGNLKKISLMLALVHEPEYLLLDEPTTGLDHQSRDWFLDYLDNYPGRIIVTSHEESFTANEYYLRVLLSELNQYGGRVA